MRSIGRMLWGIDASVLYASIASIKGLADGARILDVPCGGGIAFRAMHPGQDVRYVAADLSEKMLARAQRRARARSLSQVEFVVADMTALPFPDGETDLFLSYSGLHMVSDPERAVMEIGRCLKPDGHLLGTTFVAEGSRRARALFGLGGRRGHPLPPRRGDLHGWFGSAGIVDLSISPQPGFVAFSGRKRSS